MVTREARRADCQAKPGCASQLHVEQTGCKPSQVAIQLLETALSNTEQTRTAATCTRVHARLSCVTEPSSEVCCHVHTELAVLPCMAGLLVQPPVT